MRKYSLHPNRLRRSLFALVGFVALTTTLLAANNAAIKTRMQQDLEYLASEECEGRGVETKGLEKAAVYIAEQFKKAGLKPGNMNNSYFQPFTITGAGRLQKGSRLILHGPQGQTIELTENRHFAVMGFSGSGKVKAPVVFVGYGATAPRIKYDDFKGVDVEGKIVIVLRRTPNWDNKHLPFDKDRKQSHAALVNKLANAEIHKAAAVLMVSDRSEIKKKDKLLNFRLLARGFSSSHIPALHVKRDIANQLLSSSLGKSLIQIEEAIDRDLQPRSSPLQGWTATIDARVQRKKIPVKNVIGVLEGNGPLADEIVIVGAHYDHLGYGESGSRAKKKEDRKKIHFGADDNASGTTAVIELARRFGQMKNRQGRKLVFMAFSAEEKGLLGSRHYCKKNPLFPLKKTVAMVNMDMVGRLKEKNGKVMVHGVGTAKGFEKLIDKLNKEHDLNLSKVKAAGIGGGSSDHESFYRQDIPVFFFWTGVHKDYHRPSDTAEKINLEGMLKITNLAEDVVSILAQKPERPEYVYIPRKITVRGKMPRMGIVPAYDNQKKGLLVDGVSEGGGAIKGGMKAGDLIVEIAGRPVTSIQTYMAIMQQQKRGKPLPVTVIRNKKKVNLKVVPQ